MWHSAGALPLSVSLARDGTGFAPHASGPSYLRLAFGARLWAVWPPTATPWAPTADRYKALLERVHLDPNVSICVQRAGEAVVVPTLWGSATVSVGDSLGFGGTRALEPSDVLDHRESILAPPDGAAANVHLQLARAAVVAARAGATSARGIAGAQEVAQQLAAADADNVVAIVALAEHAYGFDDSRVASIRRDHDACPKARGELLRVARKDKHDPLALAALQHLNSVCPERAGLHEGEPRRTAYEVDRETFRGVTKIEL